MHVDCLSIAFRIGDMRSLWERTIVDTTGGPFVHAEIALSHGNDVRAYSSFAGTGFTVSPNRRSMQGPDWRVVSLPLHPGGYKAAYGLILQTLAMNLPYNNQDLWQCCFKLMLPFEQDLDCNNLETWRPTGVFCSQACLLLLRKLAAMGVFSQPALVDWAGLNGVNSRGCSPNALYTLLTQREKKVTNQIARTARGSYCPSIPPT